MAAAVEKCIKILQTAKTDNEHFAALLLVSKVTKAEDCDDSTLYRIYEGLDFSFLTRLLRSSQVPEGCSPNAYRTLAVTILSCFFAHPQLAVHSKMSSCLSHFNDIITQIHGENKKHEDGGEQLVSDCYDCLTCMAAQASGRAMLIRAQTVSALCLVIQRHCTGIARAQVLLHHIVSNCGNATWHGNEHGLHMLLSGLAAEFKTNQGERKFDICSMLGLVLSTVEKEHLQSDISQWSEDLHMGLSDILQSKIGSKQRDPALLLASAAVDLLGVPWTLSPDGTQRQFLLVLVHLACIEVRMTLEDRDLVDVQSSGTVLVGCYRLLENLITYLTTGPTLGLDERQVTQVHAAMVGAFNSVLYFLTQVCTLHPSQRQSPIVIASVRVLGSWIAEETSALQREVRELLPFLISVCSENLKTSRHVTVEGSLKSDAAVGAEQPEEWPSRDNTSPEVIRFLLPGLCHLSADDEARHVLMEAKTTELLVDYFKWQWELFGATKENEECKMSLATLCSVLLNMVVLDGKAVADSETGPALLSCVVTAMPTLEHKPESLVLGLNLAVLGLMLLRHYTGAEQSKCEGFCKAATNLLSRAHCRKRSDVTTWTVQVTDGYAPYWEDCAELWFLAMQALAADISLYPWLTRVLLGAGFVPIIIRLLKDVKGDTLDRSLVMAYQGILVAMAQNDKMAKQLLKEQQAQQLARTHKMDELRQTLAT